ncbi:MAG: DUF2459 domain-containing protein [Steroidobacteraceae bacterium]
MTRLTLALGAALLAACASAPSRRIDFAANCGAYVSSVYVVKRGWHIDVGFSAAGLSAPLSWVVSRFPGSRYVLFGFGDRRYLTAKHKSVDALLAALRGGPGLMLVTYLSDPPQAAFGANQVVRLPLTAAQAQALQSYVWDTLSSRQGVPVVVGPGPYPASLYLGSGGRYSAFHTCNTWAAQALRSASLPIHSAGVIFAAQLWPQVRAAGHRLSCRAAQIRPGTRPSCASLAARPR